jgi:hypothetical protein
MGLSVADDDIGLATQDRFDQRGNIRAVILVVAIGVHDNVRAAPQAGVDSGTECRGQPFGIRTM